MQRGLWLECWKSRTKHERLNGYRSIQSGLCVNGEVTDEDCGVGFGEGSVERVNVGGLCGLILGELGLG